MRFNKKYKNLLLDTDTPVVQSDEKVNIILSPSIYWVKKLTILVKNVREVKKLLPSIFEDTLPEGNYSYSAYKNTNEGSEESEYFVFAYEDKKIIDLLASKNISMGNVSSIHFAQSELGTLESAYSINEDKAIYVKDGVVVLVPSSFTNDAHILDLDSVSLSKHTITLQQFGHIVDNKSLYRVASVLMVLMIIIVGEFFITKHRTDKISTQKDEIFAKHNLKSTMFQNKAMLKKYEGINKNQSKIRKYISKILSIKLQKDEKLNSFELKGKVLYVVFSGVKKGHENYIESKIKALTGKHTKLKKKYSNEMLKMEIVL